MDNPLQIRRKKASAEKGLLKLKGVTGVGIGEKISKGKRTGTQSIRVYVKKKAPKTKVAQGQMIPSSIDGVPTDVIEREFVLHPGASMKLADLEAMADSGTYDPLRGGISIGPCRSIGGSVFVGTLGLVVEDNTTGERMMLSNFHVMCVDDAWSPGDTITQPALAFDGGTCPAGIVGELTRASLGGQVDCAVARITARDNNCAIVDIGSVNGTATAVDGEAVRKRGRTTELTHGFVDDTSLTVSIDYEDGLGVVTLTNQIGIEVDPSQSTQFGNSGDSGSVVVNANNEVIGLYFAGTSDGSSGVANPIAAVFSALDIRLCRPIQTTAPWIDVTQTAPGLDVLETDPWRDRSTTIWETSPWQDVPETSPWRDVPETSPWRDVPETSPWRDAPETRPWLDVGGTINKNFDDVKNPSGYDTMMETIQEENTWQEHGGNTLQETIETMQENIGGWNPRDPRIPRGPGGRVPFALATPHHAAGAARFEAPAGGGSGGEDDLEAEIERARNYLATLQSRKRSGG